MTVEQVIETIGKRVCIDTTSIEMFDGRGVLTDGYTTIMAGTVGVDIKLWPLAHKKFVEESWIKVKNNKVKATNNYQKVVVSKLGLCDRRPKIDIIYETIIEGIEVVVYTDDIDSCVLEAKNFKGD